MDKFEYRTFDGKLHRIGGPAIEHVNGHREWWINGKRHREDGPAVEHANGGKEYWRHGVLHREDGPAIERVNGDKFWYVDGTLHREDGPTIETQFSKIWTINGRYHRTDGPAVEHASGYKEWWLNGKRHREDGPAIEYTDGRKEWFFEGKRYLKTEYEKLYPSQLNINQSQQSINLVKENTKMESEKPKASLMDMVKSDAEKAGYRVASTQITAATKTGLLALLRNKGMDNDKLTAFKELLDTELGDALISAMLGYGLTYAPTIKDDPRVAKLATEFRTNGMTIVGNEVVTAAFTYLMPSLSNIIENLPAPPVEAQEEPQETHEETKVKKAKALAR